MLETAPSFDIYSKNPANDGVVAEETEKIDAAAIEGSNDFSFVKANMGLIKEDEDGFDEFHNEIEEKLEVGQLSSDHTMYLAAGLGVCEDGSDHDFGDFKDISEEKFWELLQHYPTHPLLLKKYAELLQENGDLQTAAGYYSRAVQADPEDGETMMQYARLVWELHRDQERALTYFELAAQAAPENSNVMAAFAKFLWEVDDDGDDKSDHPDSFQVSSHLHHTDGLHVDTDAVVDGNPGHTSGMGGPNENEINESYYQRMVEKNPTHPFFLKKYAQLLYQSKGDLQGAEEYYSRAVVSDPQDGEILSQFATLLWELYHDQDRTLSYLERAIEVAPQDSDVLAAYARILWTIDDE